MKPMSFWNYFVSVFFTALGLLLVLLAKQFPMVPGTGDPGSGFWPTALGTVMIALSVLLTLQSLISPSVKEQILSLASESHQKVYFVMGLSVLFCLFVYLAGFYAASLFFIYAVMGVLGVSSRKERILIAFLIDAAVFVIFSLLLKTAFPLPVFMS